MVLLLFLLFFCYYCSVVIVFDVDHYVFVVVVVVVDIIIITANVVVIHMIIASTNPIVKILESVFRVGKLRVFTLTASGVDHIGSGDVEVFVRRVVELTTTVGHVLTGVLDK